jgi:pimeloyl-ACP methyl ester carboxylesterase
MIEASAYEPRWCRRSRAAAAVLAILLLGGSIGCGGFANVWGYRAQEAQSRKLSVVRGTVETEAPSEATLVVVLSKAREVSDDPLAPIVGVDTYVRLQPGSFVFVVAPGRYQLGAYEDRNRNGLLDPGENLIENSTNSILELGVGSEARQDLVIPMNSARADLTESINVFDLIARTPAEQRSFGLWAFSVQGEVVEDLSDPRFGAESGSRGLWRGMDFLNDGLAGIYQMEPYDADRIPVLFVHGIAGYPQELSNLLSGIDPSRYQAWFYFYPSGFDLPGLAAHLATLLVRMQVAYGFEEIALVGHSVGGLIARAAALQYRAETLRKDVRLLVSISSPWGGDPRGDVAVAAPIAIPESFKDLSPGSEFLHDLFFEPRGGGLARDLPAEIRFHLLFSYRMAAKSDTANDGSVPLSSQLWPRAQVEADGQRGYDLGHAAILNEAVVVERLNELLSDRFD